MRDSRPDAVLYTIVAVAMACTVGLLGYRAGNVVADADGAYARGVAEGVAHVRERTERSYRKGGAGHRRIYAAGVKRGRRLGFGRGRRAGLKAGRHQGFDRGADSAFAGFKGGWQPGSWYLVRIAEGQGRSRYSIPQRVPLAGGRAYRLCAGDPRRVCQARDDTSRVSLSPTN